MYNILSMWNLKEMIQMNLQNRKRPKDLEKEHTVAWGMM